MTSLVKALASLSPRHSVIALLSGLALFIGCTRGESAGAGKNENPQNIGAGKAHIGAGRSATEIEALIHKKLDSRRVTRIDEDEWGHTKRLYKLYGNNPHWLTSDGLHKIRTK